MVCSDRRVITPVGSVGLKRLEKINMVAMTALFLMTLVLCFVIVTRGNFGTLFNGSSE